MRILRPYSTEEEFVRGDGLTIGRMGMILIGAPPRPPGIIIRFEIVLSDGQPVFRGEGKVVAHRVHANGRKGLEVRFTRLDSRSKAVIEKALELRKTGELTASPTINMIPDLTPSPVVSQAHDPGVSIRNGEQEVSGSNHSEETSSAEAASAPVDEPVEAPIVDNDPTPFAPRVMIEEAEQAAVVPIQVPTEPEVQAPRAHVELDKLRGRHSPVPLPPARESLLDKLRNRMKRE
jgi:hypothetical protein